ncbi:hypothetical protein ASG41_20290 [Modestobacter sp. Leaf380]|nr:hypothetical protein ASG41_20290 [Modestobacter sp. Leaf380]
MDDVVVVGAGPTGCTVAGELARAGCSVTVLDRHAAPSPLSRAFGVHARTLELLDSRGLADELVATGTPVDRLQLSGAAGLDLSGLPTRFPFVLMTPQVHVDRLLERYAVAQGARVERGVTVDGLEQRADGVVVRAGEREWAARWVVGADGVRSAVRDLVGLPFPGRTVLRSVVLADVRLSGLAVGALRVDVDAHGFGFLAPFGDGWFRLIGWDRRRQPGTDTPVGDDEVAGRRDGPALQWRHHPAHDAGRRRWPGGPRGRAARSAPGAAGRPARCRAVLRGRDRLPRAGPGRHPGGRARTGRGAARGRLRADAAPRRGRRRRPGARPPPPGRRSRAAGPPGRVRRVGR